MSSKRKRSTLGQAAGAEDAAVGSIAHLLSLDKARSCAIAAARATAMRGSRALPHDSDHAVDGAEGCREGTRDHPEERLQHPPLQGQKLQAFGSGDLRAARVRTAPVGPVTAARHGRNALADGFETGGTQKVSGSAGRSPFALPAELDQRLQCSFYCVSPWRDRGAFPVR